MQFALLALAATAYADNLAAAIKSDVDSNLSEYISALESQTGDASRGLLSMYSIIRTYSDDSYTTVLDAKDFSSLSTYVTHLPWYTRIEALVNSANSDLTKTSESSATKTSDDKSSTTDDTKSDDKKSDDKTTSDDKKTTEDKTTSDDKTTTEDKSTSKDDSSTKTTTTHKDGANALAPGIFAGAFIGAVALL